VLINLQKQSDMEWWSCVMRGRGFHSSSSRLDLSRFVIETTKYIPQTVLWRKQSYVPGGGRFDGWRVQSGYGGYGLVWSITCATLS